MNVVRNDRKGVSTVASLCVLLALAGCDKNAVPTATAAGSPQVKKLPTAQVTLAGQSFQLELAITPPDQERGLMYRTTMGEHEGMIFVFPKAEQRYFYMKNTLIPLDIAYLDNAGTVLNIPKMYPHDLTSIASRGPARYAIELNQGTADHIGLHEGDHVEIPAALR